jgi:hypothetical protein
MGKGRDTRRGKLEIEQRDGLKKQKEGAIDSSSATALHA